MRDGDFARAFAATDATLAARDPAARDDPALPYHERWVWGGAPLAGRDVLVRCYHGLGDTLMFARYLPELRRVARHVTVEVQPALAPLLRAQRWIDDIVPFHPDRPLPPAEVDIEIMELAHALRSPPTPRPYLHVEAAPAPDAMQVGLCWHASPTWQPERSIAGEMLKQIIGISGLRCSSLQRGATNWPPGLVDDCPSDLLDAARRIASLDLVITVDTMVAHLAGALGVPVWLMLHARPDWRWLVGGDGSVWYRGMRQFRQERDGDWTGPIECVRAELLRRVAGA